MNPLREWAWKQYDHYARTAPGTDECKAAWKIHLAAGATRMAGLRTAERPSQTGQSAQPTMIVAASDMNTAAFAAHFSRRHKGSLGDMTELPPNMDFNIEQMYRAFHTRLHGLRRYRHEHKPDAPEVGIDRALECLFENHDWGWKQLAGVEGLIAVFPNGQIAVKFSGSKAIYFNEIDEATDCLLSRPSR